MPEELAHHFVAFLDILGFSSMVTSNQSSKYLAKLYKCHQSLYHIFSDKPDCTITQFSDSIVIAYPFDPSVFRWFVQCVAKYQRLLLDEQLLCRGGIAVDKHFSNASFTFSPGLIAAYRVERLTARYPRVAVSQDAFDPVFPNIKSLPGYLIRENDGIIFVDYIGTASNSRRPKLQKCITNVVTALRTNTDSSIREKGLWLAEYSDAVLGTQLTDPRFLGASVSGVVRRAPTAARAFSSQNEKTHKPASPSPD